MSVHTGMKYLDALHIGFRDILGHMIFANVFFCPFSGETSE